jgi:hypothetical protein|eukprot:Transcript_28559.p1 GENE.Transcript_28559~~Transcript_28559.p1  ORF type:complete len:255 (-),score=35.10 Transcript_28559:373-1137(-)
MLRTFWTILGSGKRGVIEDVGVVKRQALPAVTEVEDAEVARSDGSTSSMASSTESGDEAPSMPPSPILPPSPVLSSLTARPPPALRKAWPKPQGESSADGGASSSGDEEGGLHRLQDQDPELYDALNGFLGAFRQSSLRLCMRCRIAAAPSTPALDIIIDVGPEGASARTYEPSTEWPVAPCTISCERDVLIAIIRGDTSPMNALLAGRLPCGKSGRRTARGGPGPHPQAHTSARTGGALPELHLSSPTNNQAL